MCDSAGSSEESAATTPRAFVSHATADQDRFVRAFAERLQANGVDSWYSEWSLLAGDSLVDRIFERGIAGADNFIVVLSKSSVASNWVTAELGAGVVRKIERKCRLIPILIDNVAVPEALKATYWVRIADMATYDKEFDDILRAIFGQSSAPPLGPPPKYTAARPPVGLTPADAVVFEELARIALECSVLLADGKILHERCQTRGLSDEAVVEGVQALDAKHMIEDAMSRQGRLTHVMMREKLVFEYLREHRRNVGSIQRQLLAAVVNAGKQSISLSEVMNGIDLERLAAKLLLRQYEQQGLLSIDERLSGDASVSGISPLLKRKLQ